MHRKSRRIKFVYKEGREKDHVSHTYSWDLYNRLVNKGKFHIFSLFQTTLFRSMKIKTMQKEKKIT